MPEITNQQIRSFESFSTLTRSEKLIHDTLIQLANAQDHWTPDGFENLTNNLAYVVRQFDPADVKSYFAKVQQSRQSPGRS